MNNNNLQIVVLQVPLGVTQQIAIFINFGGGKPGRSTKWCGSQGLRDVVSRFFPVFPVGLIPVLRMKLKKMPFENGEKLEMHRGDIR